MGGVFITGTDTGIGKTVVCAALLHYLRRETKVCYWKPVQTGIEQDDDTESVRILAECNDAEIFDSGIRLERPLSPHLSARLGGVEIDVGALLQKFRTAPAGRFWIVEGAGGLLVPLNSGELIADLAAGLGFRALVAASSALGTINHTLLTLEALRSRGIGIAGVVMNGPPNVENRDAIEQFGKTDVILELPLFDPLESRTLENWAGAITQDRKEAILRFLQQGQKQRAG